MKLTFWGAARQVTGSMYLLQSDSGYNILIDCGLSYEKHQSLDENLIFPFNPSHIHTVILTHAHIDHSGNLPTLIRNGFTGNVICTEPTAALLRGLLDDSASIQALKQKKSKGKSGRLYGFKEVKDTLDQVLTLPFYQSFDLNAEIRMTLYEAGHILGAASVLLEIKEKSGVKRIGFTGDLGPNNATLVVPPKPMPNLDFLVCESTYGNRLHKDTEPEELLLKHIRETCVDQPGRLIIPAFSIGRTQSILFTLHKLFRSGRLPNIKIINDSPLAIEGSRIHEKYVDYLNEDARDFYRQHNTLLEFKGLYTIEDDDDEEDLISNHVHASVIVSSAGMMEGGRIQQHIANNLQNPFCRILVAGFCAPGTLGHDLLHHNGTLRIKNNVRNVYAMVKSTDVFSAHPDNKGLIQYIHETAEYGTLKNVFLVHGDEGSLADFKGSLDAINLAKITIPDRGYSFEA